MGWLNVPWAIGGDPGPLIPVEAGRALVYAISGGRQGIAARGDCKIRELAVPGTSVRMLSGAVVIQNRSTGASGQAYVAVSPTGGEDIPITSTGGGGGRSDLVVVRVKDPQYPPWTEPVDPDDYDYVETFVIEDVPSNTRTFAELGLDYSAVELARIDIPASTATITDAMIHDLRTRVQPDNQFDTYFASPPDPVVVDDTPYVDVMSFTLDIPSWATNLSVFALVGGIKATGAVTNFGMRILIEDTALASTDTAMTTTGDAYRTECMTGGVFTISPHAGTAKTITIQAHHIPPPSTGVLTFDEYTRIYLQAVYNGAPD